MKCDKAGMCRGFSEMEMLFLYGRFTAAAQKGVNCRNQNELEYLRKC